MTFWTYINKELIELQPVFENHFKGLHLTRDYEDTWEWLEGRTEDLTYELNISRQHNWEQGLYDKELIIEIIANPIVGEDEIGRIFKNILSTSVYYGTKIYIKGHEYKFEIEKEY